MTDYSTMQLPELRAEAERIGACLKAATDTFSQMLLNGRLRAIHRAIDARRSENLRAAIFENTEPGDQ